MNKRGDPQMNDVGPRPEWNEHQAAKLVGARVLIGITRINAEGPDEHEQIFGLVQSANAEDGIAIALEGSRDGGIYRLPPDLQSFSPADPGEYRLRSTGEVVINPDFIASWTIRPRGH